MGCAASTNAQPPTGADSPPLKPTAASEPPPTPVDPEPQSPPAAVKEEVVAPPPPQPEKQEEAELAGTSQLVPISDGKAAGDGIMDDWDDDDDAEDQPSGAAPARAAPPSEFAAKRSGDTLDLCGGGDDDEASLNASLSCTHCGYHVFRFAGHRWADGTDYYHFRNYCPDSRMPGDHDASMGKLCARLVADAGSAAYACGCSWQTLGAGQNKSLDALLGVSALPDGGARLEEDQLLKWGPRH